MTLGVDENPALCFLAPVNNCDIGRESRDAGDELKGFSEGARKAKSQPCTAVTRYFHTRESKQSEADLVTRCSYWNPGCRRKGVPLVSCTQKISFPR